VNDYSICAYIMEQNDASSHIGEYFFFMFMKDTQTLQLMHSDREVLYLIIIKKVTTLNLTCIDAKTFASFFLSP
jgi:hypothetical protein